MEPLKRFQCVTDVRVEVNRAANCVQCWLIPTGPMLLKLRKLVVNISCDCKCKSVTDERLQQHSRCGAGIANLFATCCQVYLQLLMHNDATRHCCHSTATAAHLLDSASPALRAKTQVFWATTLYPVVVGRVVPNLSKDHDAHIFGVKQSRRCRLLGREMETPRRDHSAAYQKTSSSIAPLRQTFVTRLLNCRYVLHDFK